jgi:hypothetical protein
MTSTAPASLHSPRSRAPEIVVALIAIALPALIGFLKINALIAWRYTSDLFHIDLVLQETLRGYFTMDFAYGRQFGDHACLIFLLLLPVKFALGKFMVFLLVLLPAITLSLCGVILFTTARAIAGSWPAALIAGIYFFSLGVIEGPFDRIYGFHIDTLAGYVAVAMAALLMRTDRQGFHPAPAIVAIVLFGMLKEEMALLGIVFFAILLVLPHHDRQRSRVHWIGLFISIGLFITEMILIRLSRTRWNRGNEKLVHDMLADIQRMGVFDFFFSPNKYGYWLAIVTLLSALTLAAVLSRRINRYALALAGMGLCKFAFSWAPSDFDLWSWHNYPAVVMLTGAICLQLIDLFDLKVDARPPRMAAITLRGFAILSIAAFVLFEGPFIAREMRRNREARVERNGWQPAMIDVMREADKINPGRLKVVSIPKFSAYEWTEKYRYAFFPRGITNSVQGVADLLILPRNKAAVADTREATAFERVYQNGRYRLFRRIAILPEEQASRDEFIDMFGRDAIGVPAQRPKKKPPRKPAPPPGS